MTIHHTSVRRVMLSAHARDQRWATAERFIGGAITGVVALFAVCALPVMLLHFSRRSE